MKLSKLTIGNYRSLRGESIEFGGINLLIGANASGKSTILDALRFLPRNGVLSFRMAEKFIKAVWYERLGASPDKFVILMALTIGKNRGAPRWPQGTASRALADRSRGRAAPRIVPDRAGGTWFARLPRVDDKYMNFIEM